MAPGTGTLVVRAGAPAKRVGGAAGAWTDRTRGAGSRGGVRGHRRDGDRELRRSIFGRQRREQQPRTARGGRRGSGRYGPRAGRSTPAPRVGPRAARRLRRWARARRLLGGAQRPPAPLAAPRRRRPDRWRLGREQRAAHGARADGSALMVGGRLALRSNSTCGVWRDHGRDGGAPSVGRRRPCPKGRARREVGGRRVPFGDARTSVPEGASAATAPPPR